VALLGLLVGSFLNVCIYRIPNDESVVRPRSHCMKCGHTLGALDLVPVFSYLFFFNVRCLFAFVLEVWVVGGFFGICLSYVSTYSRILY